MCYRRTSGMYVSYGRAVNAAFSRVEIVIPAVLFRHNRHNRHKLNVSRLVSARLVATLLRGNGRN